VIRKKLPRNPDPLTHRAWQDPRSRNAFLAEQARIGWIRHLIVLRAKSRPDDVSRTSDLCSANVSVWCLPVRTTAPGVQRPSL